MLYNLVFVLLVIISHCFQSTVYGHLHINPLNAELNPICHLLALLGGATIVVVSRLRVKSISKRELCVQEQHSRKQNHRFDVHLLLLLLLLLLLCYSSSENRT